VSKALVPIFNFVEHSYTDPIDNFCYTSVTKWLERFKKPFNEESAAKRIALREGVQLQTVLDEWRRKRDESKEFGTKIHKLLEIYNLENKICDEDLLPVLNNFKKLNLTFDKKMTSFEKLVFNKDIGIAGTSDVIVNNPDSKTFCIYDFKTNKKLRYSTPFNEFLLPPLNIYPSCEYFIYSLQLSMYAYLYKLMTGLEPLRLKIFWYSREEPENYKNLHGTWVTINTPYMEEEILACLKYEQKT